LGGEGAEMVGGKLMGCSEDVCDGLTRVCVGLAMRTCVDSYKNMRLCRWWAVD
jgi:hypothetical protein